MSTYWTEEIVTTVKKRYFKGRFTGKFYSERQPGDETVRTEYYKMHIYYAEVEIAAGDTRSDEEGDFKEVQTVKELGVTFNLPIKCHDQKYDKHFNLETDKLIVDNPVLSHLVKDGITHFGLITGTIYCSISKTISETIRTEHIKIDTITAVNNPRTNVNPEPVIEIPPVKKPPVSPIDDLRHGCSCLPILGGLFVAMLIILAAIVLIQFWPVILAIAIIIVLILLFNFFKVGWIHTFFSWVFGLIFLLGILFLAIRGLNALTNHLPPAPIPAPPIVMPPDTTKKPVADTATVRPHGDTWITHYRSWSDLVGRHYNGSVRVRQSSYLTAQSEHAGYLPGTTLPQIYSGFSHADEDKLDSVYSLFDSLKIADHLDEFQFAGMVVSFVQNIPYATVTEGTCTGSGSSSAFSGLNPSANCIGGISFGVQSPVEFMANFKGDCDTRTVFLFTVFNHYHYHVAILGSNAFKHSILGIDLPLSGTSKMLGSSRFVLWETTSTGFAPGNISREVNYMEYWQFDLVNTPTL